jgi:hypothetical protein
MTVNTISKTTRRHFYGAAIVLLFVSCLFAGGFAADQKPTGFPIHGIDLDGMDRSILPGNDFFAYANGTWLKNTSIPDDLDSYGVDMQVYELTSQHWTVSLDFPTCRNSPVTWGAL